MGRNTAVFLLLSLFCGTLLLPHQEWQPTDSKWTDKNNTENYAAYLIKGAYGEHGYYDAEVQIKQAGTKRLFIVDPGPICHVKEVVVTGLQSFPEAKIVQDAPKPGDICSDARTNDWIQELVKRFVEHDGPLRLANWSSKYDHAHALLSIQLTFQERP
jgi:hypothetical protein